MTKRKTVGWLVFAALMAVIVLQLPRIIGDVWYLFGTKFYATGSYEAAARAFNNAVRVNPSFARAYVELGSSYLALENYEQAEKAFLKARSIRDESCASCGLGMTYNNLGRHDAAETAFKRAKQLDPNDVCAYDQSGRMYYGLGRYEEAITEFKRALKLRPSFGTYMYLGNAYVYADEFAAGVDAYKEAIRLNPKDVRAHVQLGIAYDYMRRYADAVEEYQQAIKLSPNDEKAHYALALAYLALSNRPAAFAEYEILRKINPDKAAELFDDPTLPRLRESGKEKLYFVPVGKFSAVSMSKLIIYYKQRSGLTAIPTQRLSLNLSTIDPRRQQIIAEEVIELIKRKYPDLAADPNAILIGLTEEDMFIRERSWQFAFSYRTQGRFAIVSSARMNPVNLGESANNQLLASRMRKMVSKNIGLLYYLLPTNHDPKSVLYGEIKGVEDLDKMGEDF